MKTLSGFSSDSVSFENCHVSLLRQKTKYYLKNRNQ